MAREHDWYPAAAWRFYWHSARRPVYEEALRMVTSQPRAWLAQERRRRETTFDTAVRVLETRRRSEALLYGHLTSKQKSQLARWGWFEVVGKTRWRKHVFRVHQHGLVYEHKPVSRRRSFCIMALEPGFPEADWMLTVKLLIEGDCRKFLDTAHSRGWYPDYS